MSDDPYNLRRMEIDNLYRWTVDRSNSPSQQLAGREEIQRRNVKPESVRSWIAVGISVVALVVAGLALFN